MTSRESVRCDRTVSLPSLAASHLDAMRVRASERENCLPAQFSSSTLGCNANKVRRGRKVRKRDRQKRQPDRWTDA